MACMRAEHTKKRLLENTLLTGYKRHAIQIVNHNQWRISESTKCNRGWVYITWSILPAGNASVLTPHACRSPSGVARFLCYINHSCGCGTVTGLSPGAIVVAATRLSICAQCDTGWSVVSLWTTSSLMLSQWFGCGQWLDHMSFFQLLLITPAKFKQPPAVTTYDQTIVHSQTIATTWDY